MMIQDDSACGTFLPERISWQSTGEYFPLEETRMFFLCEMFSSAVHISLGISSGWEARSLNEYPSQQATKEKATPL
jgi:hypothetical protein